MKHPVKRTCCPLCGGKIIVSDLYQYSLDYTLLKSGRLSKRYKRVEGGSMEVSVAGCENPECDASWDADNFVIDNDRFFDYKYGEDDE